MTRWYRADGTLVEGACLRQARKEGLLPSVTTVMKDTLAQPGVVSWMMRVGAEEAERRGRETREEGKRLHALLGHWIVSGDGPDDPSNRALVTPTLEWLREELRGARSIASEQSVVSPHGWGGTIDLSFRHAAGLTIVDVKTREFGLDGSVRRPYFENAIQLAAYAQLLNTSANRYVTLMLSRDPHNPRCAAYEWSTKDIQRACQAWEGIWMAWQAIKDYYPAAAGKTQ